MTDLIARLEALTEPSREVDAEIAVLVGGGASKYAAGFEPHYTASIDAATTLVPEGWGRAIADPQHWDDDPEDKTPYARLYPPDYRMKIGDDAIYKGDGSNMAIALCIAALRARA